MSVDHLEVTFIVPVGVYEARMGKSIIRSGASRVYLLKSKKEPYRSYIDGIASKLLQRFKNILEVKDFDRADFTDITDIYRVFTKALYVERTLNPSSQILFDVTSTTKEAVIVATMIAQAERLRVTYVPRPPLTPKQIKARYHDEGPAYIKGEIGEERIVFNFPKPKWDRLCDEEICLLARIYNKEYKSVNALVSEIKKSKPEIKKSDRYWIRILHRLEERNFVQLYPDGITKKAKLTEAGEGTVKGIKEAYDYVKSQNKEKIEGGPFSSLVKDLIQIA